MSAVEIIIEPGACHDGSLDRMLTLVKVAADAGATVFKPQFYSNSQRLADRRNMAQDNPYRAIYERYRMPLEWLPELQGRTVTCGLAFWCSVFLPEDVATVAPFVSALKLSSFEAESVDLVLACAPFLGKDRPLLLSLGMGADPNVAIKALAGSQWWDGRVKMLACVSAYPTPLNALGLAVFHDEEWRHSLDGYSDHSADVRVGAWAVAAGASILEVHARLDDTDPANPDYATALSPAQLREYVRNVRDCERALGTGVKAIQDAERPLLQYRVKA